MDIDDNDAQDQNHQFEFDDSLQGHLRFDNLVENEVFLGITSHEDDHWIEEYSHETSEIQFNSCVMESSRKNVWSEATSFESVEMLLKSVGQEEKVVEETVNKELDDCEPSTITNIMDPNPNLHERFETKVSSDCEASISEFESLSQVSGGKFELVILGEENIDNVCDDVHHEVDEIENADKVCDDVHHEVNEIENVDKFRDDVHHEVNEIENVDKFCDDVHPEVNEIKNVDKVCDDVHHEVNEIENVDKVCDDVHHEVYEIKNVDKVCDDLHYEVNEIENVDKVCDDVHHEVNETENVDKVCDDVHHEVNDLENGDKVCDDLHYEVNEIENVDKVCDDVHREVNEIENVDKVCDDVHHEVNDIENSSSVNDPPEQNYLSEAECGNAGLSRDVDESVEGCHENQQDFSKEKIEDVNPNLYENLKNEENGMGNLTHTSTVVETCTYTVEKGSVEDSITVDEEPAVLLPIESCDMQIDVCSTEQSESNNISVNEEPNDNMHEESLDAFTSSGCVETQVVEDTDIKSEIFDSLKSNVGVVLSPFHAHCHTVEETENGVGCVLKSEIGEGIEISNVGQTLSTSGVIDMGTDDVEATDSQKNVELFSPFEVNEGVIAIGQGSESNMADITDAVTAVESSKASSSDIQDGVQLPSGTDTIVDVNEDQPFDFNEGVIAIAQGSESNMAAITDAVTAVESSKASDIQDGVQLSSGTDALVDVNEDQPRSPIFGVSLLYNDNMLDCASDGCLSVVEKDKVSDGVEKVECKLVGHCDSPVRDSDATPSKQTTEDNQLLLSNAVTTVESSKASFSDIPDNMQLPYGTDDIVDVNEDQPRSPVLGVRLLYNDNEVKVEVESYKNGPHELDNTLDYASDGHLPVVDHCDYPVVDSNATLSKQTTEDDQSGHKCSKTVETSSISGNLPAERSNNADEVGLAVTQRLEGKDEAEPSNVVVNTLNEHPDSVDVAVPYEDDTILEVQNEGGSVSSDKPEIISCSDTQDNIEHYQSVKDKHDATEGFLLEKYPLPKVTYEKDGFQLVSSSIDADEGGLVDPQKVPEEDEVEPSNLSVNTPDEQQASVDVSVTYEHDTILEVQNEGGSVLSDKPEIFSSSDKQDIEHSQSVKDKHDATEGFLLENYPHSKVTYENDGFQLVSCSNNADEGGLVAPEKVPEEDELQPSNLAEEQQAFVDVAAQHEHDTIHNDDDSVSSDKPEIISCSDTQDIEHSESVKDKHDATEGFLLEKFPLSKATYEKDGFQLVSSGNNASVDVAVTYGHDTILEVQNEGCSVSSDKPEIISCSDTQEIEHSQNVKDKHDATHGFFLENYPLSKQDATEGFQLVSSSNNADEGGLVDPQKVPEQDEVEPSNLAVNTPDEQQDFVDVAVPYEHDIISENTKESFVSPSASQLEPVLASINTDEGSLVVPRKLPEKDEVELSNIAVNTTDEQQAVVDVAVSYEDDTILEVQNEGGSVSSDKPEIISCLDTQDNIKHSQSVKDKQDATEGFILENYPPSKVTYENNGFQLVSSGNPSKEEKSFTFEVNSNTGQTLSSSKNTMESSVSPCTSQLDPVKLHEHIVVSPETPISAANETVPKKTSERKPRRKSVGRESSKKVTQSKKTTPTRRSQAEKLYHTLAKDSKANVGPPSSSLNLPDLNNSSSIFPHSFTDNQQVQLRAQILVYGSLISGSPPDEPHMIAAFGQSDGGRRTWEAAWHACLERVRVQKSVVNNPGTPMQSRSGNKNIDQENTLASAQSKVISSPIVSPMIPISSPLWNFSTPYGVQASAMPRSTVLDYRPTLSPLNPYQTPQVQNIAGHNSSWLSQGPFPGQWIATSPVAPFSARFSALPITESVKLTTVKEPGIPGQTISSVQSGQPSSDTKSRKRKKADATQIQVGSHSTPVTQFPLAPHTEGYNQTSFPSHFKTNSGTAHLVTSQPSTSAPLSTPVIPKSNHGQLSCVDENFEKSVTREEFVSNIEQSKVQATDAAVQAAAAVGHCRTIWSQLETQKNSGLVSDEEAKLASSSVSIAAASSVAKMAAEAAKIASNVAEQARLMADEVFQSSRIESYDQSMVISHDKSTSIISAAREAARRRIEAASVASKHAENLDAIVKAAELVAEAVSQAGKIVAMGNPLTSTMLIQSGPDFSGKELQTVKHDSSLQKNFQDLAKNQKIVIDGVSGSGTSFKNDKSTINQKGPELSKAVGSIPRQVFGSDGTSDVDHNLTQSTSGSWKDDIIEGSFVEVYKDDNKNVGAWFAANVRTLKDGRALVCYTEIQSDDGSGKLEEWVPLEVEGAKAPRIRIAHPIMNTTHFEGNRKRGRTALIDIAWCSGDRVDVWLHDRWCEAVVVETNNIDATSLTVQFPAQEKTSVARSWHVRPTLMWKDGKWIEWSSLKGTRSSEGDTPHEKRQKVSNPVVDGNISSIVIDLGEPGRPKGSKILSSSAQGSLFDVGKSSTNENKLNAHRTIKSGIQKERSRVVFGIPKPGKKQKFVNVNVADANDSDKIPSHSMSCGSKDNSKNDAKEIQVGEVKSKFHKPRKPPIPLIRPIRMNDKAKTSESTSDNASLSDKTDKDFVGVNDKRKVTPSDRKTTKVQLEDKLNSEAEPRRSRRKIQPTSRLLEGLQSSLTISKMPTVSHANQRSHKVTPKGNTNSG